VVVVMAYLAWRREVFVPHSLNLRNLLVVPTCWAGFGGYTEPVTG
jgi:hypothetical protein